LRRIERAGRTGLGGCVALGLAFLLGHPVCAAAKSPLKKPRNYYLPGVEAARLVTVTKTGEAEKEITILTEAVATKETGPKESIARFGEVYAFAPDSVVVRRDQPTRITFWNLQPDDEHDFALVSPNLDILMYVRLPPLEKTSYVFTFHEQGLFDFWCLQHQPEMSGQILVLPEAAPVSR
jgi:plastocyanin